MSLIRIVRLCAGCILIAAGLICGCRSTSPQSQQVAPQRQLGAREVMSIKIKKVERHEDRLARYPFAAASSKRPLQRSEIGTSAAVEHDGLTVEDRRVNVKFLRRSGYRGKRCVQS